MVLNRQGMNSWHKEIPQPQWTLSTDLTQYTSVAELQALGRGGIGEFNYGSYTMANGNGIEISPSSNYVASLYYYLDTPLTSSNKVTMHCTGRGSGSYYAGQIGMGICTATGDSTYTGANMVFYTNESGIRINGDVSYLDLGYGDFDLTISIDLSTGEIVYSGTTENGIQTVSQTRTMTAQQISDTLAYRYLIFQIIAYTDAGNGNCIKTTEFLIE